MMIISYQNRGNGCHTQELSERKKEMDKKDQHQEKRKERYKWKTNKSKRKKESI